MAAEILETDRLILRNWKEEDLNPFQEMNRDPEVMAYFVQPLNRQESDDFAAKIRILLENQGYGLWALEEKQRGEFIGFTGLYPAHFEADFTPCTEIGWRLRKDFWRKGLATEAALAVLTQAFSRWNFPEIFSFTSVGNLPSRGVMEKIGLKKRGEFLHPLIDEDHPLRPHVLYGINADEWTSFKGPTDNSGNDIE